MKQIVFIVLAAAAVFAAGYGTGRRSCLPPSVKTDTLYIDREFTVRDTVYAPAPDATIIYRPAPATERECIDRPADLPRFNLTPLKPLRFARGHAYVSIYNPRDRRWEQQAFRVPLRKWGYGLSAFAAVDPENWKRRETASAGLRSHLRFRRVTLRAEGRSTLSGRLTASLELETRLWGKP